VLKIREMERFNAIKNRYWAKYLKYQNNKWYLDDVVGDLLEKLVALAFERLEWRVTRGRTRNIDMTLEKSNDPSKKIVIETTNWEILSTTHSAYYYSKIKALEKFKKQGYTPVWIMTFFENFDLETDKPQDYGIEVIETRKQLLPQNLSYDDYKELKRLIKAKLKELGFIKR